NIPHPNLDLNQFDNMGTILESDSKHFSTPHVMLHHNSCKYLLFVTEFPSNHNTKINNVINIYSLDNQIEFPGLLYENSWKIIKTFQLPLSISIFNVQPLFYNNVWYLFVTDAQFNLYLFYTTKDILDVSTLQVHP